MGDKILVVGRRLALPPGGGRRIVTDRNGAPCCCGGGGICECVGNSLCTPSPTPIPAMVGTKPDWTTPDANYSFGPAVIDCCCNLALPMVRTYTEVLESYRTQEPGIGCLQCRYTFRLTGPTTISRQFACAEFPCGDLNQITEDTAPSPQTCFPELLDGFGGFFSGVSGFALISCSEIRLSVRYHDRTNGRIALSREVRSTVSTDRSQCVNHCRACCFPSGGCQLLDETTCRLMGGVPLARYDCLGSPCAGRGTAIGPCCKPDGSCVEVTRNECQRLGGVFQGVGPRCADINCPPPPATGACCIANGVCQQTTGPECVILGGSWQAGVPCVPNPCTVEVGACCGCGGECRQLTEEACIALGTTQGCEPFGGQTWIWRGAGVPCDGNACTGACCQPAFPSGYVCVDGNTLQGCNFSNGLFQGFGVQCATVQCPQSIRTATPTEVARFGSGGLQSGCGSCGQDGLL